MDGERLKEQSQAWSPGRFAPTTTKPGALAPGVCLLSRGAFPRGSGAAVRSVDRFQITRSLVVGRSCRRWHLGPGVEWDVPLGPGHLGRCNGRRRCDTPGTSEIRREVLEQGPDRQRAPICCSGGVSSINGASESRCSHDGPGSGCQQGPQPIRHRSSPGATGLHEGGFTRGSQGVSVLHHQGRWLVPKTALLQAVTGTSQAHHHWPEGVICS